MGLWEQFLILRAEADALVEREDVEVLGNHVGWSYCRVATGVDELVEELSRTTNEPCIGAWVADSDSAAILAAGAGMEAVWLAVNEDYEGDEDAETTRQWTSPELQAQAARSLAAWSARFAPVPIGEEQILAILHDETLQIDDAEYRREFGFHLLFAEDGLREIFERMGFEKLDDAVFCR